MEPPSHDPTSPRSTRWAKRSATRWVPVIVGALSACIAYAAIGRGRGNVRAASATPTILGARVAAEPDAISLVRTALRAYLRAPIVLELGDVKRTVTRESLGVRIDEPRLAALAGETADPESALMRGAPSGKTFALPLPLLIDSQTSISALNALKDDLDRPAEDAKLDLDARKVLVESAGRRIDVFATVSAVEDAVRRGAPSAKVAWLPVAPALTQASLGQVEMIDTLGYFETHYATDHKHVDRTYNLRIAASKLNGKVIMPGETFDFNTVVGPRDELHGYRVAKVIADGELVDGMGGGTCQIAGTLHAAALFAGLEVAQRTPHTRPSYYIKMGLDAAVAYPTITLRLKNPFSYPVVLRETVVGGVVRAEVLGPRRARVVTFIRKIDEVFPFPERVVDDPSLPPGKKVVSQRGIPGFKVRRYRVVRDGPNAVRERTIDSYPPTLQIVHVGSGGGGGGGTIEDDHPEYIADEYLAITQGPGIGHLDGIHVGGTHAGAHAVGAQAVAAGTPSGMEEVRIPGKTGTKGWTRKYTTGHVSPAPSHDEDDDPSETPSAPAVANKHAHPKRHKK